MRQPDVSGAVPGADARAAAGGGDAVARSDGVTAAAAIIPPSATMIKGDLTIDNRTSPIRAYFLTAPPGVIVNLPNNVRIRTRRWALTRPPERAAAGRRGDPPRAHRAPDAASPDAARRLPRSRSPPAAVRRGAGPLQQRAQLR